MLLYRDVNVAAASASKLCILLPSLAIMLLAKLLHHPYAFAYLLDVIISTPHPPPPTPHPHPMGFENMIHRWSLFIQYCYRLHLNALRSYFQLRDKGVPIQAVRYEDLANKPDQILPRLLELASMSVALARLAETALSRDAHSMAPFNKEKMDKMRKKARDDKLPDEFLEEIQELYVRDGVPGPLDWKKEPQVIPGTIL